MSSDNNLHYSASGLINQWNTVGLSEQNGYFLLRSLLERSTYSVPELSKMRTWPAWACLPSASLLLSVITRSLEWAFLYQSSCITEGRQIISVVLWPPFSWTQAFIANTSAVLPHRRKFSRKFKKKNPLSTVTCKIKTYTRVNIFRIKISVLRKWENLRFYQFTLLETT